MINITRKMPESNFIKDIESMFNLHINSKDFDEDDLNSIRVIDNAEVLDLTTGLIKTPYGLTSIKDLSTGCKTVLVYNYCRKNNINKVINITEGGANALNVLFELMSKHNDSNTIVYLGHRNLLETIKSFEFNVDGRLGDTLCIL